ncbi:MAG TPA: PDZ domain-containing protein, partial [Candidatus Acidoferrales bacterium]|nr:PDZ domain-containing protein [Candidatus Acidoferrales bacterium]
PAVATIHYKISLKNPEQHSFQVTMAIPHPASGMTMAIPAWNALYQIRDFAYRIRDVEASSSSESGAAGEKLPVRNVDKQSWEIRAASGSSYGSLSSWTVRYSIVWDDSGPFNSQLNAKHAFINFAEVLMYIPDRRGEDTSVEFEDVPTGWRAAAELPAGSTPNSFLAASYDTLVDAPVEIGKFEEFDFDEGGARFRVVVDAKSWRRDRLEDALRHITSYEMKLMGGPPFHEYTFFFHIGPYPDAGGGGMEHANCTAIGSGSVEGASAIAAHEFFHAWNVKRIRPQTLEPVDFTKEQYTRALWFAEGVTSAYAAYTLERSGLWPKEKFYTDLAAQISDLDSRPARQWQSAEESSLDAWLEKYDEYRQPDRSISYYNKGQIVGEMLDLAIRDATDNRKSLDDVMRRMNDEYANKGKFYDDSNGVRAAAEEVAGTSLADFFQRYIAGTDEIPYDKFLNAAGLEMKVELHKTPDLGFWIGRTPGSVVAVSQVAPGSSAETAGLLPGDVLLQVNGENMPVYLPVWVRQHSPGETLNLRVQRNGKEIDISFALGSKDMKNYSISEISHATERQKKIREGWLRGTAD